MKTKSLCRTILAVLFLTGMHLSEVHGAEYFKFFMCGEVEDAVETVSKSFQKVPEKNKYHVVTLTNYKNSTPQENLDRLVREVAHIKQDHRIMIDVTGLNFEGMDFSQHFNKNNMQDSSMFSNAMSFVMQNDPSNKEKVQQKLKFAVFNFEGCNLDRTIFNNCYLRGANFNKATARNAIFNGADLSNANDEMKYYYLAPTENPETIPVYRDTSFEDTNIDNATFDDAILASFLLKRAKNFKHHQIKNLQAPKQITKYSQSHKSVLGF